MRHALRILAAWLCLAAGAAAQDPVPAPPAAPPSDPAKATDGAPKEAAGKTGDEGADKGKAKSDSEKEEDTRPDVPSIEPTEEELLIERRGTVSTASRRPQELSRSSAATTVITAQEIRESGAQRITDLMRSVAGVNVTRFSVDDVMVNVRGLNTPGHSSLMLLIDGRPVQMEFFEITLWEHLPVVLETIEKIEVVRGPASPTYGANAFSGVINIITKDPGDAQGARTEFGAGSHGWTHARGYAANHGDRGGMWLSAGYLEADAWSNRVDPAFLRAQDRIVLQRDHGETQLRDFHANWRGTYDLTESITLSSDAGYMRSDMINFLSADTTWIAENSDHAYLRLAAAYASESAGDFTVRTWARHDSLPIHTLYATPGGPDHELDDTIGNQVLDFEAIRTVKPFEDNVLTYGGGFRLAWVTGDEIFGEDEQTSVASLWLQDEYRLHETLDVTFSIRWDDDSSSGSHTSPRGAIVWAPLDSHTFRLSGGRAFRNPSSVQNYATISIPTNLPSPFPPAIALTGEPNLKAEEQTSVQLDWSTNAVEDVLFEASVFYGLLDNLIVYSPPPAPAPNYTNSGEVEIAGCELNLQGKIFPWLRGFANYALLWAKGDFIWLSPKHQGSVGLRATGWDGFTAAATLNAVSGGNFRGSAIMPDRQTDPYGVLSGHLSYTYQRAEISLSGSGMLGADGEQWPRGDIIPWRFVVSLRYRF
jgi:iron complex outermembrane receptor protein